MRCEREDLGRGGVTSEEKRGWGYLTGKLSDFAGQEKGERTWEIHVVETARKGASWNRK